MNLNKVIILGRVTANPTLRSTPGGQSVASLSIATNRVWTDKSGKKQEDATFHNVVLWGRQAEIASQYVVKGSTLLVEGRLQTRTWQDKDGNKRQTTEIICEHLQLGPKPAADNFPPTQLNQDQETDAEHLPF
jgi:single-strand DNA-binding protein